MVNRKKTGRIEITFFDDGSTCIEKDLERIVSEVKKRATGDKLNGQMVVAGTVLATISLSDARTKDKERDDAEKIIEGFLNTCQVVRNHKDKAVWLKIMLTPGRTSCKFVGLDNCDKLDSAQIALVANILASTNVVDDETNPGMFEEALHILEKFLTFALEINDARGKVKNEANDKSS